MRKIKCTGFPERVLPLILTAFREGTITWLPGGHGFMYNYTGFFMWQGCKFRIEDVNDETDEIIFLEGDHSEDWIFESL